MKRIVLIVLCLAAFVISLDTTIVNVALPSLVTQLRATTTDLLWVVDAYSLTFAALVLAAGSLSDRFGRRGFLLAGLGLFGAASLAGSFATSAGALIAARAVMGVGAAMIFPATLSLLRNLFPDRRERAKAIGLWAATTGLGIALGPILGGWLLERYWWGSVFVVMAPVAALIGALVMLAVPTSRDPAIPRLDVAGLLLSTATVGSLVYTIIEAPSYGWTAGRSLAGYLLSVALLVGFVAIERRSAHPMLDVGMFGNPRFSAASGAVTVAFFALSGFIFLVTQYFQFVMGYSPLQTGVRLLPVASLVAASSVLGTRLALRVGNKAVVTAGMLLLAVAFGWISTVSAATGYLEIALQMVVLGSGMGLTSAPATEAIMGVVPAAKAGVGSAVNDATRLLGGTLGVAVIGSVYATLYSQRIAHLFGALPAGSVHTAQSSVGAALQVAAHGGPQADALHRAADQAFRHGFGAGCLLAAGVALLGAVFVAWLLPANPHRAPADGATADRVDSVEATL
jgi:EmrB/QacA subfamily drug resistance transporter